MPMYDLVCENGHEQYDLWLKLGTRPPCPTCGSPTSTLWKNASGVIGDECDVWIRHGICNEDGSPRHYNSKKEMKDEAARRGLVNHVEHITSPISGSDKSRWTTRWI